MRSFFLLCFGVKKGGATWRLGGDDSSRERGAAADVVTKYEVGCLLVGSGSVGDCCGTSGRVGGCSG